MTSNGFLPQRLQTATRTPAMQVPMVAQLEVVAVLSLPRPAFEPCLGQAAATDFQRSPIQTFATKKLSTVARLSVRGVWSSWHGTTWRQLPNSGPQSLGGRSALPSTHSAQFKSSCQIMIMIGALTSSPSPTRAGSHGARTRTYLQERQSHS